MLSFERPSYLRRLMKYWSGRGPRVIVADGSSKPIDANFLSTLRGNIEYRHVKETDVYVRISFLVNQPTSKYSMFHADDEFFLPSALASSINSLEEDEGLTSCSGQCIGFDPSEKDIFADLVYSEFKNYEVTDHSPSKRLEGHMRYYTPSLFYSVTRTEPWKIAFDLALNGPKFSFWAGGEILLEMALAYLGKSEVINTLGWLRSKENERIQGKGNKRHSSRFTAWWESAEMENERELFTQLFAEKMSAVDGRPISVIKEEAHEGLKCYYGFSKNYHAGRHWFNRPEPMEEPMMDLAEKLVASGVSVNLEELQEIKQIVMEFHSKPVAKAG